MVRKCSLWRTGLSNRRACLYIRFLLSPLALLHPVHSLHSLPQAERGCRLGGSVCLLPEQRQLFFRGLEGVDSFDTNPHKGLLVGWEW